MQNNPNSNYNSGSNYQNPHGQNQYQNQSSLQNPFHHQQSNGGYSNESKKFHFKQDFEGGAPQWQNQNNQYQPSYQQQQSNSNYGGGGGGPNNQNREWTCYTCKKPFATKDEVFQHKQDDHGWKGYNKNFGGGGGGNQYNNNQFGRQQQPQKSQYSDGGNGYEGGYNGGQYSGGNQQYQKSNYYQKEPFDPNRQPRDIGGTNATLKQFGIQYTPRQEYKQQDQFKEQNGSHLFGKDEYGQKHLQKQTYGKGNYDFYAHMEKQHNQNKYSDAQVHSLDGAPNIESKNYQQQQNQNEQGQDNQTGQVSESYSAMKQMLQNEMVQEQDKQIGHLTNSIDGY